MLTTIELIALRSMLHSISEDQWYDAILSTSAEQDDQPSWSQMEAKLTQLIGD